jgi:Putative rhamnosyl transferase
MSKSSQQQLVGIRRKTSSSRRRLAWAFALTFTWIVLLRSSPIKFNQVISTSTQSTIISINTDKQNLGNSIVSGGLAPSLDYPFFTCPDGRKGLHIVHTRFLLGQAKSVNSTFIASRLLLLTTFFAPSLNAQSSKSFIVVASVDNRLPPAAIQGLRSELQKLKMPVLIHQEGWKAIGRQSHENMLSRSAMLQLLHEGGILPNRSNFDFYITSRMDADDAAHVEGIASVQRLACASPDDKNYRLSVAYLRAGLLWEPSLNSGAVHGAVARPDPEPRYLAILQSMITGKGMEQCTMNVYSHQHMQPYTLSNQSMPNSPPNCPFVFRCSRNIHIWEPPKGQYGSLYVRTATSSTQDKNKTALEAWRPANLKILKESFGLDESSLVLTNMFLSGLQSEAINLLVAKNSGNW